MCPRLSAKIVAQNPGDNVMPVSPPGQAGAVPAGVAALVGKALDATTTATAKAEIVEARPSWLAIRFIS